MKKQDWIDTFNRSKNELRELVEQFHPSSKAKVRVGVPTVEVPAEVILLPCPITAPTAEEACEVVRKQIQRTKPQNPLTIFDTLAEDPALHTKELTSLLSGAWFGLPESRSVRSLPGFFELCDLCEGVDAEEDTEDLTVQALTLSAFTYIDFYGLTFIDANLNFKDKGKHATMHTQQDLAAMFELLSELFPHTTYKVKTPAIPTSNFTYIHNDKGAAITMALAGVSKDRVGITITDVLTVSVDGTAKEKFRLYDDLDFSNVTAEHKDGLLTIKIPPQKKTTTSPKVIPIT